MEYSETEKQMLRDILPGIATQLRGSLANIHAALGRLAPEQARDASADTDRSAAILCQSYYRILRVVNNLSDAPMLAEEKPLDTENVELVRFLDGLCRQGEALARAILKDAPIVILDEATASVDPENEHLIQQALSALTKGKTILTIAHRLATIQHADQILVVEDGRIVQRGTHAELMTQGGLYRRFIEIREQAEGWRLA